MHHAILSHRHLLFALALLAPACTDDGPSTPSDETGTETGDGDGDGDSGDGDGDGDSGDGDGDGDTDLPPDACELVVGQTYASQMELECGLGPNGPVLCKWQVSFGDADYTWTYSDVGESNNYACLGLEIQSVPEGQVLGTVSQDGALLSWQGQDYDRL